MNHASLFSGIGGFDLAAEWMGWTNVFHCEINPFGQKILKHYWPDAISYSDIKQTDFTIHRGTIDILTGGFPCQPYSQAGKRLGKEDDRHLWPEMLRAIREIQPRWVVGENVRGLTNWNGGLVFDEVQADLEAEGYEVLPFLLPACAVNAPHRRDRIFFVAANCKDKKQHQPSKRGVWKQPGDGARIITNASGDGYGNDQPEAGGRTKSKGKSIKQERQRVWDDTRGNGATGNVTDSGSHGFSVISRQEQQSLSKKKTAFKGSEFSGENATLAGWRNFPTQSPVRSGDDGLSSELAGITVSKHRNESLKGYGNAIVPQLVFQIFKAIEAYERINK